MKIFYDSDGKILGWASAVSPEFEEGMGIQGATTTEPSAELAAAISDPTNPVNIENIAVVDGEVVTTITPTEHPDPDNT